MSKSGTDHHLRLSLFLFTGTNRSLPGLLCKALLQDKYDYQDYTLIIE
jgi:hypothetical protein